MIRINLVRQEQRRQFGKQQRLGVLVGVEMAVPFTWHRGLVERNEVQGRGDRWRCPRQPVGLTRLNEQKQQLEDLQNILEDLEANRAGPVQVLDELKVMLNLPANDLQRVAQDRMKDTSGPDQRLADRVPRRRTTAQSQRQGDEQR